MLRRLLKFVEKMESEVGYRSDDDAHMRVQVLHYARRAIESELRGLEQRQLMEAAYNGSLRERLMSSTSEGD